MLRKPLLFTLYALLACCLDISSQTLSGSEDPLLHKAQPGASGRDAHPVNSSLTAHEWGTFTSIAGMDGSAVEWSPLTGATDLPAFVEHFRDPGFKLGLRGTVRMKHRFSISMIREKKPFRSRCLSQEACHGVVSTCQPRRACGKSLW